MAYKSPKLSCKALYETSGRDAAVALAHEFGISEKRLSKWLQTWSCGAYDPVKLPRKRKGGLIGSRVLIIGTAMLGRKGVVLEKTSDPAWPFKIKLDDGQIIHLDDWEFKQVETAE